MTTNKKVRFEDIFPIIEETVAKGNQFSFCAFGISMLPFIRNGKDIVTLGPIQGILKVNDIIFYRRENGQFVLHRIVKIHSDGKYDLCGDNQFHIEKNVASSQIIAKLIFLERNGRKIHLNRLPSKIWCLILPIRRFLLHLKSAISWRMRKLFRK